MPADFSASPKSDIGSHRIFPHSNGSLNVRKPTLREGGRSLPKPPIKPAPKSRFLSASSLDIPPSQLYRKRRHSALDELNLDDPSLQVFKESKNELRSHRQNATRPLRSVLRTPDTTRTPRKPRPRVSFSPHDHILFTDFGEEVPLTEAQKTWKIGKRQSLALQEEKKEALSVESSLDRASAYESIYPEPVSKDSHRDIRGLPWLPYGSGTSRPTRASNISRRHSVPQENQNSGRKKMLDETARELKRSSNTHSHWHGYDGCGHGWMDPMPCICDQPKLQFVEKEGCKYCARAAKEIGVDEKPRESDTNEESTSWWQRLGRKIPI
ncbi:hypothetical protein ABW19_dt0210468 [Dactylella cylindrospora]|nr:hypothetical protein ABW19_dt0210468 [Dactylella cylindrospora]